MLADQIGAGRAALCAAALWAMGAVIAPAHAQPECKPGTLIQTSGEMQANSPPMFMGLTASGDLIEVRSASDGSWTIVLTLQNGSSCAVVSGDGWETVEPPTNSLLERSRSLTRID